MMAELRKKMQEDCLSQKYSITPCNATAPCRVLPPYLHTAWHLQEFTPHTEDYRDYGEDHLSRGALQGSFSTKEEPCSA